MGGQELSATYADHMTVLMVVTTYCGSLFVVFMGDGGFRKLYSTYHENLNITTCGSILSTYIKQAEKYGES